MEHPSAEINLVRAAPDGSGLHTGTALSRQVGRGSQFRIRRGIYAERRSWSAALPTERYNASMAAAALAGASGVFCRESALVLHGIPLLKVPAEVHLRTLHRSQVGVRAHPGWLSFPTRLHEPPLPRGVTRAQARAPLAAGHSAAWAHAGASGAAATCDASAAIARQLITPEGLRAFSAGSTGLTVAVEPLPLALLDTVPRLPFDQSVVVLDAALARFAAQGITLEEALHGWQSFLRVARLQRAWDRAVAFADPRAESVGESLSRVRIMELGFAAPRLQTCVWAEDREYRLDFEWEGGVVGEFDGKHKYLRAQELFGRSAEEAVYREKLREDAIRSTGRRVVRWSWDDLHRPGILRDRLARAGVPRA